MEKWFVILAFPVVILLAILMAKRSAKNAPSETKNNTSEEDFEEEYTEVKPDSRPATANTPSVNRNNIQSSPSTRFQRTNLEEFFKGLGVFLALCGLVGVIATNDNTVIAITILCGTVASVFGCFVLSTLFSKINTMGTMLQNLLDEQKKKK